MTEWQLSIGNLKTYVSSYIRPITEKECKKCGDTKDLSSFFKKGDDRYSSYCKECDLERKRKERARSH